MPATRARSEVNTRRTGIFQLGLLLFITVLIFSVEKRMINQSPADSATGQNSSDTSKTKINVECDVDVKPFSLL